MDIELWWWDKGREMLSQRTVMGKTSGLKGQPDYRASKSYPHPQLGIAVALPR